MNPEDVAFVLRSEKFAVDGMEQVVFGDFSPPAEEVKEIVCRIPVTTRHAVLFHYDDHKETP